MNTKQSNNSLSSFAMKLLHTPSVYHACFTLLCISCIYGCIECTTTFKPGTGALARGRAELNLTAVLNTTDPLYLYYWSVNVSANCSGFECINETGTCDHLRKNNLTSDQYNFTRSFLTANKQWTNESYMGKFNNSRSPPIEMMVTNLTSGSTGSWDVQLWFNQPDTYNCSVVTITKKNSSGRSRFSEWADCWVRWRVQCMSSITSVKAASQRGLYEI
ncbi:uncharacterized protein LOC119402383 isoform X2 [Rhipicephalus sanguineus]|uniref:uncharacterized protein LOC119402383 isoform X2 n=1 Tax=Rhipicephalus sanguineus TaxID=34632 RepID=UPI0018959389|nr:uncharacterized protein LOC119402383 isoform X2 [Rhipicephalus sanguineus]